jgi:NADPH2:quinone reductase
MKAWLLDKLGSLDNLRPADVPEPDLHRDDVLLEVIYAALNPADRYLAEGAYPARPPMPHILGRDGVGTVVGVGSGVSGWQLGDHALIIRGPVGVERAGTFAQRVAVPANCLAHVPDGWTLQQAGCASLVYLTAWQALTQFGSAGRWVVLITGASGGVGVAATQLASAMGHHVIALSRSEAKAAKLRQLGAAFTANPDDPTWRKTVLAHLGSRKVDLAIDNIGGAGFSELLDVMGMWGKISVVGRLAGPVPQFNTASLFFRRLRIGGVAVGTYTADEAQNAWRHVIETLAGGEHRPVIDSEFPFDQLPQAFARLAAGPMGKVLVHVK